MGIGEKMPDAPIVGLTDARCQNQTCNSLLARVKLNGTSLVEIKCRRCGALAVFESSPQAILESDGQGGYRIQSNKPP